MNDQEFTYDAQFDAEVGLRDEQNFLDRGSYLK